LKLLLSAMAPKLTAKSPARKLLLQKFVQKELNGTEDPKDVWESDPIFMEHKLSNFRTHYNNLRNQYKEGKVVFLIYTRTY